MGTAGPKEETGEMWEQLWCSGRGEPRWEAGLDEISQQGELILKCEFGLCFVNTRSH